MILAFLCSLHPQPEESGYDGYNKQYEQYLQEVENRASIIAESLESIETGEILLSLCGKHDECGFFVLCHLLRPAFRQ